VQAKPKSNSGSLWAQAEGLPESSYSGSSAAQRHPRCANSKISNRPQRGPEGSQNSAIPSGCTDPTDSLPGVCAPIRPPAIFCQPSGLKTPGTHQKASRVLVPAPDLGLEQLADSRSENA